MPKAITITRARAEGYAVCDSCGGEPRRWNRERARQHADRKRHTVRFVITDTTIYVPDGHGDA